MEKMKHHKPFQHYQLNMVGEAMSLAVYINMAQATQVVCDAIANEDTFGTDDLLRIVDTFMACLTWMDTTGIRERYPDLADMPDKVDPLDFQGGLEGLTDWMDAQLKKIAEGEELKVTSFTN